MLPAFRSETLVISPIESKEKHLSRIHAKLARSIAAGIPPIVSLRLYAKRNGSWTHLHSHFVTVTSVPGRLEQGTSGFTVGYIDPMGGKFHEGRIVPGSDPGMDFFAGAEFPDVTVGRNSLRRGEKSYLAVAGALGRL